MSQGLSLRRGRSSLESPQHPPYTRSVSGPAAAPPVSLRSIVLRGLAWKSASQIVLLGSRLLVAVALARLLAPHDFGLAGMALVFSGIALLVWDFGLGTALVQRPELSEDDVSTIFWTTVALGGGCTLAGLALARPIAAFYGEPRVGAIVAVLAAGFVVGALGGTQSALLTREFKFRELELATIAATVVGAAAAVATAILDFGVWAIVTQSLVTTCVSTVLVWRLSPWRPSLRFSRRSLREVSGFGAHLSGTSVLFYLHRNVDNLLIGRFLGAISLGLYSVAYNLILLPFNRIVDPVRGALFPALSRIQDDRARLAELWLRGTRLLAALLMPAMLGMVAVAPDFVVAVLGERWRNATSVVQVLAIVGLLQSVAGLNSLVLPVLGRTRTLFRFAVLSFVASLAGFVAGLPFGILGVAIGYLAANVVVVPVYTSITAAALGIRGSRVFGSIAGVAEASLGMFALAISARLVLVELGVPPAVRLVAVVLVGAACFGGLCWWRARDVLHELRRMRTPLPPVAEAPV